MSVLKGCYGSSFRYKKELRSIKNESDGYRLWRRIELGRINIEVLKFV